jgi:hypothetical protein
VFSDGVAHGGEVDIDLFIFMQAVFEEFGDEVFVQLF